MSHSRRNFLEAATAGVVSLAVPSSLTRAAQPTAPLDDALAPLVARLHYLTPADRFGTFVREQPAPAELNPERLRAVGLDRETWSLEVVADPHGDVQIERSLSKAEGTALDFAGLMKLAEKHAVRFVKTLTCTNVGSLFGNGIWEGVPLRVVVWLTRPKSNVRRLSYHGFHNDDAKQLFRASLALARARRPAGRLAGDSLLQVQRPLAPDEDGRAGAHDRARGIR